MKIVLDNIIFALQNHGGISVVWYELASRLLTSGLDLHFTNSSQDVANPLGRMLHIDGQRRMNDRSPLCQKLIRYRDERIKEDGKFIFHSSYYRICDNPHAINITTVHDFTYELYNHGLKRAVHSWQKRKAILHSDHIVCISENTKKDLMRFCPEVSLEKVSVVYNGVSADYHPIAPEECPDLHIPYRPHEYVIFIGSRAKYKNFELAVQAVSRSNLNLVVVGACLNEEEKGLIRKYFQDAARVFCTGPIDNRELNVLYNHALALAYPSSYEGFGIPVLEAQKAAGLKRRLTGFVLTGAGVPRSGCKVFKNGAEAGVLTSGTYSPLFKGIAVGYADTDLQEGEEVEIEVHGRRIPAKKVKTPFYKNRV